MRKIVMFVVLLVSSLTAVAQEMEEGTFAVQPKVGINFATLTDADKGIADLHFGVEAEYMATDRLSLGLGVLISNQGAKYDYWDDKSQAQVNYKVDLDYVQIPILASVYLLPGLAIKAGVQPGFKMRAKAKLDDHTVDLDKMYQVESQLSGEDVKVNKLDLSIPVGLSYQYRNICVDARYNFGLLKVVNVGEAFYNRCFMLSLGYKFAFEL